jgi:hypothetical protein
MKPRPPFFSAAKLDGSLSLSIRPGDQLSMPSKQSVWRHQRIEFEKSLSTDRFGLDRESTALLITESQPLPAPLHTQCSIFRLVDIRSRSVGVGLPIRRRASSEIGVATRS